MPNTTDTFWEVDGVSLNTLAWNIETLGDRMAPPPVRGKNIVIPHRRGEVYMPKQADARNVPLGMWVIGKSPEELQKNWRMLVNLLWRRGRQFTLTRRMKIDGKVLVVNAQAEFVSGLEPSMRGPKGAKFTVNLRLADPYYYDQDWTIVPLSKGTNRIDLPGDEETTKIKVRAIPTPDESLLDFAIRNETNGLLLAYEQNNIPLESADDLIIDVDNYEAELNGRNVEQYVVNSGDEYWMVLQPGTNLIKYTTTLSNLDKEVQLMYKAAWL